jgi:hypothetical protein
MATVHQVINAPLNTESSSLGPVTIGRVYPTKTSSKATPYTNFEVSDDSGKAAMTIWGVCPQLSEGAVVTFKGKITPNEYQGKRSISANDVSLEAGAVSGASGGVSSAPNNREAVIVRQNALAHATRLVVASGVTDVYTDSDTVIDIAKKFTQFSLTGEGGREEVQEME